MEPAFFDNFICNAAVAGAAQQSEVNRQSIVARLIAEDNENSPSDF